MRTARSHCRALAAAALLGFGQDAAFSTPVRAGFFDFLFGPFQGPPAVQVMPRHRHTGQFHHPHRHRETQRIKLIGADHSDPHSRLQGLAGLMEDDSLRKGDVVVMADGIRVFVGPAGSHHEPEDFRMPSDVKGLSKRERNALAAMEVKGSALPPTAGVLVGRSATEGTIAIVTATDSHGRTIRYVGP